MKYYQLDAQAALGFVESQRSHIEPGVIQTVYPDVQYPELIPVDTSAHPFAKTVTYYSGDMYGAAKWINGNSDDIPLAGTEMTQFQTPVYTGGIGYGYGFEEIGAAMQLGVNLSAADAAAARRASEEFIDGVALRGSAEKNLQGLINNSGVAAASAPTGNWGAATLDQIIADFNTGIRLVWSGTLRTSIADTVLLPFDKLDFLGSKTLGNGSDRTVLSFLKENNTYTQQTGKQLTIRGVRGLETAGAGPSNRMVSYRRSPEVLKLHMPMPHRFLNPWQPGPLRVEVPGVMRLGGLDIRRTGEVKYTDGI